MTTLNPYIHFKDNAREAMEFYKSVFGGKLTLSTFKESNMVQDPKDENLIMHSELRTDHGIVFMGSDTPSHMEYRDGERIDISLSGENEEELTGYWDKLKEAANITQPLQKAPWGDTFGMLTDKYGINWLVNISGKKE
jgi:PhnB protein